ncbi:MAG: hypothetical protein K2I77_03415, partial [Anaeroplasmataceae bacterium]|nr:hypothetical protein [Anaeroplasmataceae bacterium]
MEYVLIIGHDMDFSKFNFKNIYIICVYEGSFVDLLYIVKLDVAIGDFDSINQEKYDYISSLT